MLETTRKVLRTIVQVVVGLLAVLPLIGSELGTGRAAAAYAGAVAVAAVVTRVMHSAAAAPLMRWLGLAAPGEQPPGAAR